MFRKFVWAAALIALVAVAGCGGKKAMDEPAPATDTSAPAVEETRETPVETPTTPSSELDPAVIGDVFFDFDSYALTSEAKSTLETNARELKRATTGGITIEGHCDERGTKAYNLALGEKRANAAKEYLVALGVSASRINTVSYGKERPFDPGHDESAWAKNRRAHFVVNR
jgi:peptidoglycan-associated lipoprotein